MRFLPSSDSDGEHRRFGRRSGARQVARTEANLRRFAAQPSDRIDQRLAQLRREWSVERSFQLQVAAVGLLSSLLAVTRDRRWGLPACGVLAGLLVHATTGWDPPPVRVLRWLGQRTRNEIDREAYALKALRGDFDGIKPVPGAASRSVQRAIESVGAD